MCGWLLFGLVLILILMFWLVICWWVCSSVLRLLRCFFVMLRCLCLMS